MKKRLFCLLLVPVFILTAAACGEKTGEEQARPVQAAQASSGSSGTKPAARKEGGDKLKCVNCLIGGRSELNPEAGTDYLAQADLPEGMTVDHWELDGVPAEEQNRKFSIRFTAGDCSEVRAVLRPELKVSAINAAMQFLDSESEPGGVYFDEFVFEYDYLNHADGQIYPGGSVSVRLRAIVPEGMKLDYWLINGMPFFPEEDCEEMSIMNITGSMVFEAVLRDRSQKATEPGSLLEKPGQSELQLDDWPVNPPARPQPHQIEDLEFEEEYDYEPWTPPAQPDLPSGEPGDTGPPGYNGPWADGTYG